MSGAEGVVMVLKEDDKESLDMIKKRWLPMISEHARSAFLLLVSNITPEQQQQSMLSLEAR